MSAPPLSQPFLLPDMPQPALQRGSDRLFFALVPSALASGIISEFAHESRYRHGLLGRPLTPERLHVSLVHLGDFHGVPHHFVEAAGKAVSAVAASLAPFEVKFDFAESFRRKKGLRPFVLRQEHTDPNLKNLLRHLLLALGFRSEGDREMDFTPHVTLLYDEKSVAKERIVPISWKVEEIVLVHSLVGQSRHIPLGRWKLAGKG